MKKTKKALLLVLCAILLVGATIAGTVAYLTDTTDNVVTNTFTVGNVEITMDEAYVNEYGEVLYVTGEDNQGNKIYTTDANAVNAVIADRVVANTYKLIPGHTYIKDPTITVEENSEDCYVFVKIDNALNDDATFKNSADADGMNTGWTQVANTTNVWAYNTKLEDEDGKRSATPFNKFTFANVDPAQYKGKTIVVNAYAIQADGFDSATAAWEGIKDIVIPPVNP